MRKFLRDVLFTVLFIALADYLFGAIIKNNYSEKHIYITHHSNEIKTLVMGNSLAETGLNTSVLGDSAWCFAISGRALYYDDKLLERHMATMSNLHTVILTLHYNLHADLQSSYEYYIYHNYRFLHIPTKTIPEGWLYRSAFLSDQLNKKNNTGATFDKFGNTLTEGYYDGKEQNHNPPHQSNVDNCIKYLTNMAKTCAEHDVRFVVVTPPFPDTWIEGCTEQGIKNLAKVTDSVNMLYPLEYKNYLWDSAFRNDSLYYNWNHLNEIGATMFAHRIKADFGL